MEKKLTSLASVMKQRRNKYYSRGEDRRKERKRERQHVYGELQENWEVEKIKEFKAKMTKLYK